MSHIVNMTVKFKDLSAMKAAAKRIGVKFNENKKTCPYYARQIHDCDHTISVKGCQYEVAITKEDNGEYTIGWDTMFPQLNAAMGKNAATFAAAYAIEATIAEMSAEGFILESETVNRFGETELMFNDLT